MRTARQVVVEELIDWLERADIEASFTETQRLEDLTLIWEYGKWCAQTGIQLGYPRQLKFRHGRPESTAWEGLRDLSDDEGLRIAEATRGLSVAQLEAVVRIYQWWQPVHVARSEMGVGMAALDLLRLSALQHVWARLSVPQPRSALPRPAR